MNDDLKLQGTIKQKTKLSGELKSKAKLQGSIKQPSNNDYNKLENKPSINNIVLEGNKTLKELGIQEIGNYANKNEIPTQISELENDVEYQTKNEVSALIDSAISEALRGSY